MVFALGNMPRQFFHEALASHRDTVTNCNHAQKEMGCIHQVNYNCHYDNLVVNTAYESATFAAPVLIIAKLPNRYIFHISPGASPLPGNKVNKGPPAIA